MKQRIISSVVGLAVLAVVLVFYETVVFQIAISLLVVLAVFELFQAAGLLQYKALSIPCLLFSVVVPILQSNRLSQQLALICGIFVFILFANLIKHHETLRYDQMSFAFFATIVIPFSFSTVLFVHDRYPQPISILYILIMLGGAWLTDSGAYFVGTAFGKHKMAPKISPKKSVEGAIGGIVVNLICYVAIAALYTVISKQAFGITIQVNYLALILLAPLASAAGIMGDLCASIIKRQCKIKDFGSIMPGHGGVMDRFDSVLFVAPTVFLFIRYVELFQIV